MTIPWDQSMNNLSSIQMTAVGCNMSLMYDLTCRNGYKDGDQNIDILDDWFIENENISICLQLEFAPMAVFLQLSHGVLSVFDQEI